MATASSKFAWIPDLVVGFSECIVQAEDLARALGVACEPVSVHAFPDGESLVRVDSRARRVAVYRPLDRPNQKLIELVLAASALRDSGVEDIALIAPYLPYMRQDSAFHPGEAVSQRVIGRMLANVFDRIVAVDPHLHRTLHLGDVFCGKPTLALSGAPAIAGYLRKHGHPRDAIVVGPDEKSVPLASTVANALGLSWTVARKIRHSDKAVSITLPPTPDSSGRPAIIVDDVISSGATIATLANMLRERNAASVDVYITHALFDNAAAATMEKVGVTRVVSCDGVHHPSNRISVVDIIVTGLGAASQKDTS